MRRFVPLLLVAVILVACSGDDDKASDPSEVTGVIVSIDSKLLGDVRSFDVKDGDTVYTLYIDPDAEYSFPLGHLHEHLETAAPVKCKVETRDDKLYALSIEDA
jgi:hypothetical protein